MCGAKKLPRLSRQSPRRAAEEQLWVCGRRWLAAWAGQSWPVA